MKDLLLLRELQQGNSKAFEEIYDLYWDLLFDLAVKKVSNRLIAQEMVQNIFEALWKNRERVQVKALEPYLKTALKFQVFKYYRAAVVQQKHLQYIATSYDDPVIPDADQNSQELFETVSSTLRRLPVKTQQVFRLSREEQLSTKEISMQLEMSEKSVEYHITRSLKLLRTQLRQFFSF